jgi:tetratricopeptide (TPR) repeat protein
MLSAVPAYALIAFFSFPGQRIEHLVLLNLMIAMLSVQRNTTRLVYPLKRPFLLIMLVLSAGAMTFAFNRYAAEKQLQKMRLYRLKQHANPAAVVWHSTQAWHNWHTIDEHGIPIKWYTGNALVALNNLEQAHFYFEQAFKEQPYHLQNLADLAAAEVNVGNYSRAKELYLRALAIFPDYGEARKNLAVTYLNTGVSDSAMKHMQLVPLPDKINFVQSLLVANPLPPYTQPIKNLLREAVLDTASMQVYRNKFAQQYLKQKNYDEAWDWYATSTALRYVDVQGMVKIAKHYAEKQDKSYYNEVLSHLREVQVSRGDAAIILAQFFMEQHDKESAVFRLKTADCPLTPSSEQLRTAIWKELALPIAEKPTCE